MKKRYQILIAFFFVAAAQIYIPASMISEKEDILSSGKTFKFLVAPIDPTDPMRGKYITLRFQKNSITMPEKNNFEQSQDVFAILDKDQDGYAKIQSLSKEEPKGLDFVTANIWSISTYNDSSKIIIRYPFNRFYMDEFAAPKAEKIYIKSLSDSTSTTYALVKIKEGQAVLIDVMIDGASIIEVVSKE